MIANKYKSFSEPKTYHNYYRLIQGDCLKVLPTLEDNSVDLVLTDPPYGKRIGGSKATIGGSNIVKANKYNIDWDEHNLGKTCFDEIKRISKEQIIFGYNYATNILGNTNNLIVWDKKCKNDWDDNFSDGEIIYLSIKTPLRIYRQKWMGLIRENKHFDEAKRIHPTQKPNALINWLMKKFSKEDDIILDPFLGSGTTMKAAQDLGRNCIGIELNPEYCNIVKKRCFGRTFLDREIECSFEVFKE